MTKIIGIIFFLIFNSSLLCYTQIQKWTLQQCIEYAKKNNLQIKQEQFNYELSEINLKQNRALLLPSINGGVSQNFNFGRTVDQFTNEFTTDVVMSNYFHTSSSINLFKGFQLLNSIKRSQIELEASQYNLKMIKNEITINITTSFLQILYNIEILKKLQQQHEITLKEIERVQKLYEIGSVSNVVLLNIESQSASEEYQILNCQIELEMSYLLLTQILDLPTHKGFEIVIPNLNIDENYSLQNFESIFQFALRNQPEIRRAELQVESANKAYLITRSSYFPSLTLGVSAGTGYSEASMQIVDAENNPVYETIPFRDQLNRNFSHSIGLNLTIPIFNSKQTKYNLERSRINIYQTENLLQQYKNTLNKVISQLHFDALSSLKKYYSLQKQLLYFNSVFKLAEEKFALQGISFLEYQDAKVKLNIAESELLQAKYEYIFKIKLLDFYMGNEIEL